MRVWQLRLVTAAHQRVFDVSRGRLLGTLVGMPVVKVTTVGRTSGQPRDTMLTAPILQADRVVLVASYGGHPTHPQWYENMQVDPVVTLVGRGRRWRATTRTAGPTERAAIWPAVVAAYDGYAAYQAKTDREIPLVVCEPVD